MCVELARQAKKKELFFFAQTPRSVHSYMDSSFLCSDSVSHQPAGEYVNPILVSQISLVNTSPVQMPHLQSYVQFWALRHWKDTNVLERVEGRVIKRFNGLEGLSYQDRLRQLGLFSLRNISQQCLQLSEGRM